MGKNTGTYLHQKAKQIFYDGKLVDKTPRSTAKNKISIELHVDGEVIGNGEDTIYIFTDRTYKNRNYSL